MALDKWEMCWVLEGGGGGGADVKWRSELRRASLSIINVH